MTFAHSAPPANECGAWSVLQALSSVNDGPAAFVDDVDTQLQALGALSPVSFDFQRPKVGTLERFQLTMVYRTVSQGGQSLRATLVTGVDPSAVDAAVTAFFIANAATAWPVRCFDISARLADRARSFGALLIYQVVGASDEVVMGAGLHDKRLYPGTAAENINSYAEGDVTIANADGSRTLTVHAQNRTGAAISTGQEVWVYVDPSLCVWLCYPAE